MRSLRRGCDGWFSRFKKGSGGGGGGGAGEEAGGEAEAVLTPISLTHPRKW